VKSLFSIMLSMYGHVDGMYIFENLHWFMQSPIKCHHFFINARKGWKVISTWCFNNNNINIVAVLCKMVHAPKTFLLMFIIHHTL
jgi:hypothetical protein